MNSKRFLKSLLMMAMLAVVGCETDGTEDNNNPGGGDDDATYTVVVNPPSLFQVDGAEVGAAGEFPVEWTLDSKISVYINNGEWVDDFAVSDLNNLKFSALDEDTDLSVGVKYIAVYPARQNSENTYTEYIESLTIATQTQDGTSANHLSDLVLLSATFYGDEDITFEHNTAILKLSFAEVVGETPESVTFEYGTYSYTLNLSSMTVGTDINNSYTAYMMIDERDLEGAEVVETFKVDYSGDTNDIVSIANSSEDYLSGYIYELTLASKDEVPYSLTANEPTAYSNNVAITWDENVVFSVYEKSGGAWVDNFKVSELSTSSFVSASTETELDSATEYIAVYPARASADEDTYAEYERKSLLAQTQEGDSKDHLNNLCQASAEFKGGDAIIFAYESAIVEVSFDITADGTPQTLTLSDGANSYVLTLESTTIGEFTAYIMVSPIAISTDVTYTVDYGGDDNTSSDTIATSVTYEAGKVYTQAITVAPKVDDEPYELTATLPDAYNDIDFKLVQSWTNGDSFTLYTKSDNSVVDTFTYSADSSKFESDSDATELSDQTYYIATYSVSNDIDLSAQTQTGDSKEHLEDYSQMSTEFKGGATAVFTYDYAIIAATFTTTSTPKTLTLTNETSANTYVLTFESMTDAASYTAYLTVDPMDAGSKLSYVIDDGSGTTITLSTTLSDEYEAGKSYTQNIDGAAGAVTMTAISTADELVTYISNPSTDAILMNDINFNDRVSSDTFTPGTLTKEFDGNSKTISNFSYTGTAAAGLFLYVNSGGVVKNLTMQSPNVSSSGSFVGAIAGQMAYGASITGCNVDSGTINANAGHAGGIAGQAKGDISNCSFSGSVSSGGNNVGGIVGYVAKDTSTETNPNGNCPTIDNCTSSATIDDFEKENGGGIAGKGDNSTISNCSFSGTINATSTTASKNIGGIVGYLATTTTINCSNSGTVSSAYIQFGGIAGNVDGNSKVLGCTNSGVVQLVASSNTTSASTGGIAGNGANGSIIAGCLNNSTKVEGYTKVGGIAGYSAGSITACHNAGPVTSINTVAGGILGGSGATTVLKGCYATDSGTGTGSYGYIVGSANGSATFTECYHYGTNTATAAKGTKCTTIQALNDAVDAMNTAISTAAYTDYIFKAGTNTEYDLPTIIKNE